jgi:hypothetical protein
MRSGLDDQTGNQLRVYCPVCPDLQIPQFFRQQLFNLFLFPFGKSLGRRDRNLHLTGLVEKSFLKLETTVGKSIPQIFQDQHRQKNPGRFFRERNSIALEDSLKKFRLFRKWYAARQ